MVGNSMNTDRLVHGLWIGSPNLKPMEILTLKSFVDMGAEFILWHYEPIRTKLPQGVVLKDGRELIPENNIFRYPDNMILGFGGGSYAGFSDVFRYKVLYEYGGWWTDLDVACLKPLSEVTDPYWFRFHGVLSVVGNIMKVPAKSELMAKSFERAFAEHNGQQKDWHHAIRILCFYIELFDLSKYIHFDECNLDRLDRVTPLILDTVQYPEHWRFIHWMNSVIPKDCVRGSVMDKLYSKYNISTRQLL